ncbi:MAG: peptidoglycan-binding protein [Candidatus Omnitrophica bacterium]|jgi:peptidoglycan hydrolase-like protein with peptidoglycan-binding domain|nr:peptidoglycan-binding protein [Candidatus Omnitrophota bacterium]
MFRKVFVLSLLVVFAVSLVGCASMSTVKQKDLEIQGLRNQVSALETQSQSKDQEINNLREALAKADEQAKPAMVQSGTEKRFSSLKDIQVALKNAGFYQGNIDGRIGRQTREAIKAFQKANNLKADGKLNKRTRAALMEYLNMKTK